MSEVAGRRRYYRNSSRACTAARGGVLSVSVCKGWSCNPECVAAFLAIIERQERQRALELIGIAHPKFRDELTEQGKRLKLI